MASVFNNPSPSHASFAISTVPAYGQPPLNAANPNWQKQPGYIPPVPQRPATTTGQTIKNAINNLPSILNLNVKG